MLVKYGIRGHAQNNIWKIKSNYMKKIKEYKVIIIIVLVIILGAFYWYGYRPSQIKKDCIKQYPDAFITKIQIWRGDNPNDTDNYKKCLTEQGL